MQQCITRQEAPNLLQQENCYQVAEEKKCSLCPKALKALSNFISNIILVSGSLIKPIAWVRLKSQ